LEYVNKFLAKLPNIKFHGNKLGHFKAVRYGQADTDKDMAKQ